MKKVIIILSILLFTINSCTQGTTNVSDEGVVINGVKWATRNVGEKGKFVSSPKKNGNLYTWDEAQTVCPSGWRLPTFQELEAIADRYDKGEYLQNENVASERTNGKKGQKFTDIVSGNSMLLPIASYRGLSLRLHSIGAYGSYWCSTEKSSTDAYFLHFSLGAGFVGVGYHNKTEEKSVRCVCEYENIKYNPYDETVKIEHLKIKSQ